MRRFISWGEIRLGLRLIAKQPILSGTIILALATGICVATMGFTLRDELVNSSLPFEGGERFTRLIVLDRDGGRIDLDLARYRLFLEKSSTFEHVGAVGGRPFTIAHGPGDVESVNGAFITPRSMRLLPGAPIAGRTLIPADGPREIVGVVPDLGLSVGDPAITGGFYTPVRDEMLYFLAIRTAADPLTLVAPLRAAVANVDPDLQLEEILPLEDAGIAERAFLVGVASALTAMGGMALLLSIVGIYALLSFMVTRRTREIGIRVTLGATHRQVLSSITGGALAYLAVGGVLGSALGVLFVQMRSLILISIPEPGFWMPATIFLTLAIAGATACWLPARRALGIRPAEALNSD
jgi:hypothetical protein